MMQASAAPVAVASISAVVKASDPDTAPPSASAASAYLSYLTRLHAEWKDAPKLAISYRNLSVVFPKPLRATPTDADKGKHAASSPPNLLTTLAHWSTLPARFVGGKMGCAVEPPLYALEKVSGIIQPGSMTLVLAPPGHGKTTLLRTLSGRVDASALRGELLYNGMTRADLAASGVKLNRLAAYVGQLDLHFPSLTVLETLQFAAQSSCAQAELLPGASKELLDLDHQRAAMLVELLGLSTCSDVIVGSDQMRGVSGGQKKRVTLGEMVVSNARLFALDEVSTGLDAAVTASIFGSLKSMCAISGCSVVTALLQPTPETYELFDQVILLHEGRVMYHGARSEIKRWLWEVCGVDVPSDVDEASFLVDFLVNPQAAYESAQVIAQAGSFIEATRPARQAEEKAGEEAEQKENLAAAAGIGRMLPHQHSLVAGTHGPLMTDPDLYGGYSTYTKEQGKLMLEQLQRQGLAAGGAKPTAAPASAGRPLAAAFTAPGTAAAPKTVAAAATEEPSHVCFHFDEDLANNESPENSVVGGQQRQLGGGANNNNRSTLLGSSATYNDGSNSNLSGMVDDSRAGAAAGNNTLLVPKAKGFRAGNQQHSTVGAGPIKDMRELHSRYKASRWHAEVHSNIADGLATKSLDPSTWSAYSIASFASANPHSYAHHVNLCFSRQSKLFRRNLTVMVPRMCKALSIGLFYGLLFFQLGYGDFTEKLAVCMYGCIFAAMTNLSELPVASEARNVISKQLDSGFFPASPYTFAVCAMHIPMTIFESICYGTLIYWISGMESDAGRFFFYLCVCFICSNAMAVFYRFVSYITPNPDVAKQLDLPFVVLFIILNGYIIVYDKIPAWLRYWAFWVAPLQWGTKALAVSEYSAGKYSLPAPNNPAQRIGDYYLDTFGLPTDTKWEGIGCAYLLGWYFLWMSICVLALKNIRLVATIGSEREKYTQFIEGAEDDWPQTAPQRQAQHAAVEMAQLVQAAAAGEIDEMRIAINDEVVPASSASAPAKPRNAAFQLSALPFVPVTLAWSKLRYSVTLPSGEERTLLRDVSGFGAPGEMTALMGASGAGKTTLMDCIAGRKTTGNMQADILLNGQKVDIRSAFFQQLCGYCEQMDLHIGTSTVEEALRFSARMRLPTSVSVETQHKFVGEVMQLLGLDTFAHSLIGDAAIPGLAPAQLKLLTIGVELVANPSILFLDEPTSGLDAPAAWRVMTAIKRIALTGRNVMCTIHQPAARLFLLFDRLLLLQPGGRTIYFHSIGARGETLVSYFEAATNFKCKLPAGVNPAGWMLDVSSADGGGGVDWPAVWDHSKLNQQIVQPQIARLCLPASFSAEQAKLAVVQPSSSSAYASWWTRYSGVQGRLLVSYWRNGPMNLTRAAIVIIISLLLGLIYYKIKPTDYAGVNSFMAGIFMTLGFGPSLPCSAALPTLFRQRAVYYRESTVRMYDYKIYALSLTVAEFLTMTILMMLYIIPLYFLMDLSSNPHQFWRMYLILFLLSQVYAFISQFYLAFLPNQVSASVVHSIVFSFLFVFGGLLVTAKAYPAGWKWLYAIISTPKAFVAVTLGQLACSDSAALKDGMGCGTILLPDSSTPVQVYEYVSGLMQNSSDSYGNQVGWLILICGVIKIFTIIGFKKISHLKR